MFGFRCCQVTVGVMAFLFFVDISHSKEKDDKISMKISLGENRQSIVFVFVNQSNQNVNIPGVTSIPQRTLIKIKRDAKSVGKPRQLSSLYEDKKDLIMLEPGETFSRTIQLYIGHRRPPQVKPKYWCEVEEVSKHESDTLGLQMVCTLPTGLKIRSNDLPLKHYRYRLDDDELKKLAQGILSAVKQLEKQWEKKHKQDRSFLLVKFPNIATAFYNDRGSITVRIKEDPVSKVRGLLFTVNMNMKTAFNDPGGAGWYIEVIQRNQQWSVETIKFVIEDHGW